jgi:hypothetical protein
MKYYDLHSLFDRYSFVLPDGSSAVAWEDVESCLKELLEAHEVLPLKPFTKQPKTGIVTLDFRELGFESEGTVIAPRSAFTSLTVVKEHSDYNDFHTHIYWVVKLTVSGNTLNLRPPYEAPSGHQGAHGFQGHSSPEPDGKVAHSLAAKLALAIWGEEGKALSLKLLGNKYGI